MLVNSISCGFYYCLSRFCLLVFGPWIWLIGESLMACASACCKFFNITNKQSHTYKTYIGYSRFAIHEFAQLLFLKTNAVKFGNAAIYHHFTKFAIHSMQSLQMQHIHKIYNAISVNWITILNEKIKRRHFHQNNGKQK